MYKLSQRSIDKLNGVDERLQILVHKAIAITPVDFGVIEGLRTYEQQESLVLKGVSQTMKSKHLSGEAVDLMAYIDGRPCWELNVYDDIADAIKKAAIETDVPIRWGCAWHIPDIRQWGGTMEEAMNNYIDLRRREGKRPFLDGPHFEIG
jgi:peptidoglycan L-alanyl-D-glutamate endopeptidase CwlK